MPRWHTLSVEDNLPQRVQDKDTPAYRYAMALSESATKAAGQRVRTFKQNWDFLLGRDQWATPGTTSAVKLDQWAFRGVVNWTFATVKTKAAMITGAQTEIFCEPMDEQSTYMDRLMAKSAIEHELSRLRFDQVKRDAYLWGSVTGVGISMLSTKPDPLTGVMALVLTAAKSTEFFKDPSADSITDPSCRYVVWTPELDMSTVRAMFPSKAKDVKPTVRQISGDPSSITYKTTGNDDNLIYGNAGDFLVDSQSILKSRKAVVHFVWIKDESLTEELRETIIKPAGVGYRCVSCGMMPEDAAANEPCPICGGDLDQEQIPQESRQEMVTSRTYPYGRLIVCSSDVLLYDGENPYEIESVFPFAVYHHERVPGDFYGTNDVALLASLQDAQNRTVGQLIDYIRLAVNGPFEYAVGCKSYTELGNGPGERHPVPDHLFGKSRFVIPDGFNVQAWSALHSSLGEHFQVVSGLGNVGFSQTSSPPISATEAEIANSRLSDRMKGHAQEFGSYCSDLANLCWQMMQQFYEDPRTVSVSMPDSEIKSIEVEVQKLPKMRIKAEVNTQGAIRDKLIGQNLQAFVASGGLDSPYADVVLEGIGIAPGRIKELMARRGLHQEITPAGLPTIPQPQGGPGAQLQPQ